MVELPGLKVIDAPFPSISPVKINWFRWGSYTIGVSQEPNGYHISVSHPKRYPRWDDLKRIRYALTPHNITMGILFPPPDEYVNLHKNCFHLHEIPNCYG